FRFLIDRRWRWGHPDSRRSLRKAGLQSDSPCGYVRRGGSPHPVTILGLSRYCRAISGWLRSEWLSRRPLKFSSRGVRLNKSVCPSNRDGITLVATLGGEAIMALMQSSWVLSDDLLERCAQRAADYDRENRFFFEDFDELREAKYLLAAVPTEFGGLGLTLAEICW